MAGEIQFSYKSAATCYFLVRSRTGTIWNTSSLAFEAYATANYAANYGISATEQGTASAVYVGNFPTAIAAGVYSIVAKQQLGASPAETDPTVAVGDFQWNGTVTLPLSDLATSGQIGQFAPIRLARGVMVQNFGVYMKSAADNVTPLTSGVISGQIQRDGGTTWGPLQSGAFTEVGQGFYNLQALTSGDLLANTARILFTGAGQQGAGVPVPLVFVLQRTSGQV